MAKRKKGALSLYALMFIVLFLMLAYLYFNIAGTFMVINRVADAAEEGARVRAQAVDIYLKEAAGLVEVFHPSSGYDDNVDHFSYLDVPGHKQPKLPSSYQSWEQDVDTVAKQETVDFLAAALHTSAKRPWLRDFSAANICFDIKPLPQSGPAVMDFSCDTSLGSVSASNVPVSSVDDNTYTIFVDKRGVEKKVSVMNVVFIGIRFRHEFMFEKAFTRLGVNADQFREKSVWSIAYPQVDDCFGVYCKK